MLFADSLHNSPILGLYRFFMLYLRSKVGGDILGIVRIMARLERLRQVPGFPFLFLPPGQYLFIDDVRDELRTLP